MNRNTILYILVALLVVGGVTWLVVSRTSEDVIDGDTTDEIDSDDTTEEDDDDTDTDETDQTTGENGEPTDDDVADDGTGTTVGDTSGVGEQTTPPTGGAGEADVTNGGTTGVTTSEDSLAFQQETRTRLETQIELLEALVTVVALELEAGEITPEEAASLLDDLELAADELEIVVEKYNQRF